VLAGTLISNGTLQAIEEAPVSAWV
jgi:hypothetical protein